jgi:3-deoxy-D-manno-octulosonate 8-phosphate phosphatase (KDO 8-P phosphatase)
MHLPDYFRRITTFVFDMDGVLTDGTLLVYDNNQFIRRMHIKDGYALQLAVKKGFRVVVISGSNSDAVTTRLNALGVKDVFMKEENKQQRLENYMQRHSLKTEEVLFMGDDIPDYLVMKMVGLACCPADAVQEIKDISRYISPVAGGFGCVRDVIEKVLKLNDAWHLDASVASR